jgi:methylated-DNA-[protein]-cysteine S-methyltransferase
MSSQHFLLESIDSPTGRIVIVTDHEDRVRALDWQDCESRMQRLLQRHYGSVTLQSRTSASVSGACRALQAYFEGDLAATDKLEVVTRGSEFQRQVWAALRRIPIGCTMSYGALAASVGHPQAARAVGLANGSNPIAIAVPCHRVIGANRSLTGFAGGLPRKRWLLDHENINQARLPDVA